jgi:tetratricopeptide (TPR) repeat protein
MRKFVFIVFVAFLFLFIQKPLFAQEQTLSVDWQPNLETVLKKAKETNKNIIVDFYAKWCKWCKRLADSTFTDPNFIKWSQKFVMVKVDAEEDSLNAKKYGAKSFPNVILLTAAGKEIDRIAGYAPTAEFIKTMDGYLKGEGTLEVLLTQFKKDTTNVELIYKIADKYEGKAKFDDAIVYYKKILTLQPNNDSVYFSTCYLLTRNGYYDEAIAEYHNFIKKFPQSKLKMDAELYIGYTYAQKGEKEKAIELYQQYLKNYPQSPDTGWVKKQIDKLIQPQKEESK